MSLGFSALAVVELLYFIVAAHGISDVILPIVDIELQHVILFALLCLFAVGILNFNNSGKRIKWDIMIKIIDIKWSDDSYD